MNIGGHTKIAASALAALVILVGCGGGDEDGAATAPAADEQHDLAGDVAVVVHEVVDPLDVVRDRAPEMRDAVASDGNRFVAVELEHVNNGDGVVDMSMSHAVELVTDEGHEGSTISLDRDDMPEPGNAIPPESSARGWRAWEIPEDDTLGKLLVYSEIGDEPVVVEL